MMPLCSHCVIYRLRNRITLPDVSRLRQKHYKPEFPEFDNVSQ